MSSFAYILNSLAGGGAERVTVTLANEQARLGHSVSIVLAVGAGPYLSDVAPEVTVHILGARMMWAMPALARLLRKERFEAIFAVLDQPTIACLLLRPFLSPTRVIVVECNDPNGIGPAPTRLSDFLRKLRPLLYPYADAVVAKAPHIGESLLADFGVRRERLRVIPNPVDLTRIEKLAAEATGHRWFGESVPIILAVGRLDQQKDYPTLFKAFAKARRQQPLRLVVLGEGPERFRLEALAEALQIRDSLDMPGFSANPYAYMARAACVALSSRWEGWPNVLAEALACGTRVISTEWGNSVHDILGDGRFGRIVPVGDADALSAALVASIGEAPVNAVDHIRQFATDRVAHCYVAIIEEVRRG